MRYTIHATERLHQRAPKLFKKYGFSEPYVTTRGDITVQNRNAWSLLEQDLQKIDTTAHIGRLLDFQERHGVNCVFHLCEDTIFVVSETGVILTVYQQSGAKFKILQAQSYDKSHKPIHNKKELFDEAQKKSKRVDITYVTEWDRYYDCVEIKDKLSGLSMYVQRDKTALHELSLFDDTHEIVEKLEKIHYLSHRIRETDDITVLESFDFLYEECGQEFYKTTHNYLDYYAVRESDGSIHFLDMVPYSAYTEIQWVKLHHIHEEKYLHCYYEGYPIHRYDSLYYILLGNKVVMALDKKHIFYDTINRTNRLQNIKIKKLDEALHYVAKTILLYIESKKEYFQQKGAYFSNGMGRSNGIFLGDIGDFSNIYLAKNPREDYFIYYITKVHKDFFKQHAFYITENHNQTIVGIIVREEKYTVALSKETGLPVYDPYKDEHLAIFHTLDIFEKNKDELIIMGGNNITKAIVKLPETHLSREGTKGCMDGQYVYFNFKQNKASFIPLKDYEEVRHLLDQTELLTGFIQAGDYRVISQQTLLDSCEGFSIEYQKNKYSMWLVNQTYVISNIPSDILSLKEVSVYTETNSFMV